MNKLNLILLAVAVLVGLVFLGFSTGRMQAWQSRFLDVSTPALHAGAAISGKISKLNKGLKTLDELEEENAALLDALGRDRQVKVECRDGYEALRATLPPKERRGLVLVDPPFEEKGEMERLGKALREGLRRFATGQYLLWYPIKARADVRLLHDLVRSLEPKEALVAELTIWPERTELRLNGTGMVIVNPPYGLREALADCLPLLARTLAREGPGGWRLEPLSVRPEEA